MGQAKLRGNLEQRITQSIAKSEMRTAKDKFLWDNEQIRIQNAIRLRDKKIALNKALGIVEPELIKPIRRSSKLPMSLMLASLILVGYY